jgi:hypothetical protein
MRKSIFTKIADRTLFSSKEVGSEYGISAEEMQVLSRVLNIGQKMGWWVYTRKDIETLAEVMQKYGRLAKKEK